MESVLVSVDRGVGEVRLNRPHVLNALDLDMVTTILKALTDWLTDTRVSVVVIRGLGDRAFCAGGDLQSEGEADDFLRTEYRLNALISEYPKPVVSLMHGLVLGGGVGLAAHAAIRVVTDDTRIGMPETRIGLTPDVGGSWLLWRAPDNVGIHLALTSGTVSASAAIDYGFADLYIPQAQFATVAERLREARGENPERVLAGLTADCPGASTPVPNWIAHAYETGDLDEALSRLAASGDDGQFAANRIREMCPTAVAVTFRSMKEIEESGGLRGALQREYALIRALSVRSDLREGVRSRLVDRDTPRWVPASLDAVEEDELKAIFATPTEPLQFTDTHGPAHRAAAPALR